jgi:hypothetical protein
VRELLDSLVWPQPTRTLPITFSSAPFTYGLSYQGEDYKYGGFGHYLPLVRMLQKKSQLSAQTVEALVQYEKQAQRAKRLLLLWGPVLVDVVPLAAVMYIGEDLARPFKDWSAGSLIATGLGLTSFSIGVSLMIYSLVVDPGTPFRELGLVNRGLVGSK